MNYLLYRVSLLAGFACVLCHFAALNDGNVGNVASSVHLLNSMASRNSFQVFEDFLRQHSIRPGQARTVSRAMSASSWSGTSVRSFGAVDEIDRRLDGALAEVTRLEDIARGRLPLSVVAKGHGDGAHFGLGQLLNQLMR